MQFDPNASINGLSIGGVLICVIIMLFQFKFFVRPEDLEKKHREILEDAEKKFAALSTVNDLKAQFTEIKCKIDQIYDFLLKKADHVN